MLYYGCRHKAEDYLYREELEEFERTGVVTQLNVAFSRDQREKVGWGRGGSGTEQTSVCVVFFFFLFSWFVQDMSALGPTRPCHFLPPPPPPLSCVDTSGVCATSHEEEQGAFMEADPHR